ncbi:MAG: F0F1 ATP synthase subunit gamma [Planctomycetota bacterium]
MKPISELKKELLFNREMNELMDILKKTAIFEFQSLFNRRKTKEVQNKYLLLLEDSLKFLPKEVQHPFLNNPLDKVILILITSDMGFIGGLNVEVVESGLRQIRKNNELHLLVLGEKGYLYLQEKGYDFDFLKGIETDMNFSLAEKLRDYIYASCWKYSIGRVVISFPKFISFARQEIETTTLVPCGYLFESSRDEKENHTTQTICKHEKKEQQFIFEPSSQRVLDYLLKTYLSYKIYDIFWQAKLSEFAARSMHLDGSMQELQEAKKGIQSQYFRSKHEITDRTIRDIFGGRISTLRKTRNVQL